MKMSFFAPYLRRVMTIRLLTIAMALVAVLSLNGEPVDSLYITFLNSTNQHKLQAANDLFKQLKKINLTDSVIHFDNKVKPDIVEAYVHYWMTEYYYDQELYDDAITAGNRAYEFLPKVKDDYFKSDLLGIIANTQFRIGAYDLALETLLAAYNTDKKLGDETLISSDLNTLAAIYLEMKHAEHGIKCIEKSLAIERKLKRSDRIAIRLGLASELYLLNNETDKAMKAIEEAYDIDSKEGREEKAAIRLSQKGAVLEHMSRLNEALQVVNRALTGLQKHGNNYSIAVCHNQLGRIHNKLGNRQQAIDNYKKALEMSIKCGAPNVERQAERGLWESMRDENPAIALLHLERYTALDDSLHERTNLAKLKALDPSSLSHNEESRTSFERYRTMFIVGASILSVMLLLSLAGLFYAWRKNRSALKIFKQSQELRSHFINNITNKLHTPLTVIMGAGEQLVNGNRTSAEENRHLGQMIVNHGNNMLGIVNQLMDINNINNATDLPDRKTGDIVMFVRMLVDNFTDEARQKFIHLEFKCPLKTLTVNFTPDHLRRILQRLIANALKFTSRNGNVTIELTSIDHNKMKLVVSDTGKGIPIEERDRIFEPFFQKDDKDNDLSTALDLTLVNQLVKDINGSINVDSEINQGTAFTIIFPVQQAEDLSPEAIEEMPQFAEKRIRQNGSTKQKPLVFIVENSEDIAFFIASKLRDRYELRLARDGREAFTITQDLVPDLIITATIMPVMDGKELMKTIRANSSLNHIPIIALTSRTGEQERISCIEAGADVVLVKPFNSSELQLVTERLIKQRTSMRERFIKIGSFNNNSSNSPMSKSDKEFINRLVDVIHVQMSKDDIDMEHIAAALSLSRKQLRSRVMAITGLNPVAYVLQVRLNYARRMISTTDISLTTIAIKCGFQNLSHFSKAFKQQFGVSPIQFRKNLDDVGHTTP